MKPKRLHFSTDPTDPDARDTSWRVGAIYRCCKRQGMDQDWALEQMKVMFGKRAEATVDIWFRPGGPLERERAEYLVSQKDRTGRSLAVINFPDRLVTVPAMLPEFTSGKVDLMKLLRDDDYYGEPTL